MDDVKDKHLKKEQMTLKAIFAIVRCMNCVALWERISRVQILFWPS